jgi:enhancing lycopene biosynthesis protein 2
MGKKIGVLLAGCGVKDGSEIHEAVLTLFHLSAAGADVLCMAPDADQYHVVDHVSGNEASEKRNMLTEAARIARGNIQALDKVNINELEGLILPGGFGAAKNLIDYAFKGRSCSIRPDVKEVILKMHQAGKPIGAICIAPVVLAAAFSGSGVQPLLTIGSDASTAADIESFGAKHQKCTVDDIVIDQENKIVTTPAYMLGPAIADISAGIEKLVKKIIDWAV